MSECKHTEVTPYEWQCDDCGDFFNERPRPSESFSESRLTDALKLALMFHRGGIWSAENVAEWRRITGSDEATTKVMCDHIRKVLG